MACANMLAARGCRHGHRVTSGQGSMVLKIAAAHCRSFGCLVLQRLRRAVLRYRHSAKALSVSVTSSFIPARSLSMQWLAAMGWRPNLARNLTKQGQHNVRDVELCLLKVARISIERRLTTQMHI